jgi:hypothetical protein
MQNWSAGITGVVSGLPSGQAANIFVYALPPVPGENYSVASSPPDNGGWHYPDALIRMATVPPIGPQEPLSLTLTVSNGPWGVIANDLISQKYLVLAQALGLEASPPAYQAVVFGGKIIRPTGGVDFDFGSK